MDKKTVAYLKKKFPRLFKAVVQSSFLSQCICELDRFRFWYCMLCKKPYFGTVALAGQTWQERKSHMRQLVRNEIQAKGFQVFHLLEIGSWAGNSAVLWAEAIKLIGAQGIIFCVDSWRPYFLKEENVNVAAMIMDQALRKDKIFKLFMHNINCAGHGDIIHPIRGSSAVVLPFLAENSFDVIYVDGDHSYSGIKTDVTNAARLLRVGGVLCGDDYDIDLSAVDLAYAQANKERNIICDPKTQKDYHPGVCLAVDEFFKQKISSYDGFWAMRKTDAGWHKVTI